MSLVIKLIEAWLINSYPSKTLINYKLRPLIQTNRLDIKLDIGLIIYLCWISSSKTWYWAWVTRAWLDQWIKSSQAELKLLYFIIKLEHYLLARIKLKPSLNILFLLSSRVGTFTTWQSSTSLQSYLKWSLVRLCALVPSTVQSWIRVITSISVRKFLLGLNLHATHLISSVPLILKSGGTKFLI